MVSLRHRLRTEVLRIHSEVGHPERVPHRDGSGGGRVRSVRVHGQTHAATGADVKRIASGTPPEREGKPIRTLGELFERLTDVDARAGVYIGVARGEAANIAAAWIDDDGDVILKMGDLT